MEKVIKFNEQKEIFSQRTLVKILSNSKYKFIPVNEYDNNYFVCILKCEVKDNLTEFFYRCVSVLNIKRKPKFIEQPLSISVTGCYGEQVIEPIVFDREEVCKIVKDIPENYIGEAKL